MTDDVGGTQGGGAAAGGGAGATAATAEAPKTVAKEHFDAVVTAKTGLERDLAQTKAELQKAMERVSTLDTVSAELGQWRAKATEAENKFVNFVDWSKNLGITDPDVIEAFDAKHRALPDKDRPARDAWLTALREKPAEAPAVLRPWLAPQASTTVETREQPNNPANRATQPGSRATFTPEEIRAARAEAVATGNWTKWREMSAAMGLRSAGK